MVISKSTMAGVKNYWYSMTAEQRSKEMRRRQMVRKAKLRAQASTDSPFPPELMNESPTGLLARVEALEKVVAQLKTVIGL